MKFHFGLTPVDQIAPWITPSEGNAKSLSWFGLSDGWYWIEIDGHELLRYSNAICNHCAKTYPEARETPYIDYQVVRLWEDILQMLPDVLEPVPDDLAFLVAPNGPWSSGQRWQEWSDRAQAVLDVLEAAGEDVWELYHEATVWWRARHLDSGYLRPGFGLCLWRIGDIIQVRWDNNDAFFEGIPVWQDTTGSIQLTIVECLDAVRSFDARFLAAMGERVAQVTKFWSRPDIAIDLEALAREQRERATWLEVILATTSRIHPWAHVRTAIRRIESEMMR